MAAMRRDSGRWYASAYHSRCAPNSAASPSPIMRMPSRILLSFSCTIPRISRDVGTTYAITSKRDRMVSTKP